MTSHHNRATEWMLALLMLAWGIAMFVSDPSDPPRHYKLLLLLAPETVWAAWAISLGLLRIVALYINGNWYRTPAIRLLCANIGMTWWLVLGFMLRMAFDSGPIPAFLAWFPVFIGFEAYAIYRSAQDCYHSGALQWSRQRV